MLLKLIFYVQPNCNGAQKSFLERKICKLNFWGYFVLEVDYVILSNECGTWFLELPTWCGAWVRRNLF